MVKTLSIIMGAALAIAACGSKQPPAPAPQAEPAPPPATPPAGAAMSADECAAAGGEVVGDIGDGAIHRPDYRCPRSGEPPLGHIAAEAGKPVAIEGAVCCK